MMMGPVVGFQWCGILISISKLTTSLILFVPFPLWEDIMNDALGLKLPQFMKNPRDEGFVSTIGMDGSNGEAPWERDLSCNCSFLACATCPFPFLRLFCLQVTVAVSSLCCIAQAS